MDSHSFWINFFMTSGPSLPVSLPGGPILFWAVWKHIFISFTNCFVFGHKQTSSGKYLLVQHEVFKTTFVTLIQWFRCILFACYLDNTTEMQLYSLDPSNMCMSNNGEPKISFCDKSSIMCVCCISCAFTDCSNDSCAVVEHVRLHDTDPVPRPVTVPPTVCRWCKITCFLYTLCGTTTGLSLNNNLSL